MLSPVCTSKRPTLAYRASSRKSYCQIYCESLPTPTLQSSVLLCTSTNISQGALRTREHCRQGTVWCLLKDPLVLVPQEMLALKAHGESKGACDYGPKYRAWWMEIESEFLRVFCEISGSALHSKIRLKVNWHWLTPLLCSEVIWDLRAGFVIQSIFCYQNWLLTKAKVAWYRRHLHYCFCSSINQSQKQCGFRIRTYLWGFFVIP